MSLLSPDQPRIVDPKSITPNTIAHVTALKAERDAIKKLDKLDGRFFWDDPRRFMKRQLLELFCQYSPAQSTKLRELWENRDTHLQGIQHNMIEAQDQVDNLIWAHISTPDPDDWHDITRGTMWAEQRYASLPNPYFTEQLCFRTGQDTAQPVL